jgi:hypothetical protein
MKSKVIYVPKIVYWKRAGKKQKVDLGYYTLTDKKKGDKIKSVL